MDMGLYVLAADSAAPAGYRLVAACDGAVKPCVTLDVFLPRGRYIIIPVSMHALIYHRRHPYGFVLHSSKVVELATRTVKYSALASAMVQRSMKEGRRFGLQSLNTDDFRIFDVSTEREDYSVLIVMIK